jgi:hypothetical protein
MFTLDPNAENFLETLSFILKLVGGAGGLILFFIGLRRYITDQNWKRNEFVAKEMKDFNNDIVIRNAMYILDWGARYIQLFPDKPNYEDRYVKVDRSILKRALQFHPLRIKEEGKDRFTATEVAIRDTFDHFFSYFERFNQFIEAGLLTKEELEPYLRYLINSIATEMEESSRNVIYHYIHSYGFSGTQNLFKVFGKDILPKTDIESTIMESELNN